MPLGPDEIGAQWYARARLGVRCLACKVWGAGQRNGRWLTYLSRCQELTGKFSLTILTDMLSRISLNEAKKICFIMDCGPHFRAYEVVATAGTALVDKFRKDVAVWYGLECHLKGFKDGVLAFLNQLKAQSAADRNIDDIDDLVKVFTEDFEARLQLDEQSQRSST